MGSLLAAGVKTGLTLAEAVPAQQPLHSHLDQLVRLISELFGSGVVVLVLDDLHWADAATIDLVMALALKVRGPLLLVLAYRPDDLRPTANGDPHPLTRAVFRLRRYRPDCREIQLERLSPDDTRSLILAADRSHRLSSGEVDRLVEQSGGVPLYAESLAVVSSHQEVQG